MFLSITVTHARYCRAIRQKDGSAQAYLNSTLDKLFKSQLLDELNIVENEIENKTEIEKAVPAYQYPLTNQSLQCPHFIDGTP
jgi:hypothetical protein